MKWTEQFSDFLSYLLDLVYDSNPDSAVRHTIREFALCCEKTLVFSLNDSKLFRILPV